MQVSSFEWLDNETPDLRQTGDHWMELIKYSVPTLPYPFQLHLYGGIGKSNIFFYYSTIIPGEQMNHVPIVHVCSFTITYCINQY